MNVKDFIDSHSSERDLVRHIEIRPGPDGTDIVSLESDQYDLDNPLEGLVEFI